MNGYSRAARAAGVPLAFIVALLLLVGAPVSANAAPQGPWVLPASDLSAIGENATDPQVAIAPDGSATAVWHRSNGTNRIVQASTRPPGGAFASPVDLSATGQNASEPQIAIAPDGSTTAVWSRFDGANEIIQAATRPAGGSFAAPVDLSAAGQSAYGPQLVIAADGSATAVWFRSNGTNQIVQVSTRPPGGAFAAPVDLSATGQDADSPQIAIAPDGSATAVWSRSNGTNYIVQASSRPPGGAFAAPVDLSATGHSAYRQRIAIAPDGRATVVWYRSNGTNQIVQASTRPPGGTFAAPVDLSAASQNAYSPQIKSGPDGSATAVWSRSNGTNYVVQATTRPPGGAFAAPVDLSATGQNAESPQITSGPDGSATVAWFRSNGTNYVVQASTRPPGGAFAEPVDLSATGQDAESPQITSGPDGSATVVWPSSNGVDDIIQSASTAQPSVALNVTRSGDGQGKVTSIPAGIDCGTSATNCTKSYLSYTEVTLTASAEPGSSFTGWSGACSGAGSTCEVTMLEAEMVNAEFKLDPPLPPSCQKATLKLGKFKLNRRRGTGVLKTRIGAAGKVILKGSKSVKRSVKTLKHKGTVALKVKAKGKAARQLKRRGKVKVKIKVTFRPAGHCKAKTWTRKVKLVKRS